MLSDNAFSFESALEWRLAGTADMVKLRLRRLAFELRVGDYGFIAEEKTLPPKPAHLEIRATGPGGNGAIGLIHVDELPGGRVRLRVPPGRGSPSATWSLDEDGHLFSAYLGAAVSELRNCGFLASSYRFRSYEVLQTARRELDAAEDSTSFANIGNSCRAALIALANELYEPYMLSSGEEEPKGDDAGAKLKYALRHYLGGRGHRYREGLVKVIDGVTEGVWDMASPLVHRHKTARREEAEATLALVAAVFEAFSFIVPN